MKICGINFWKEFFQNSLTFFIKLLINILLDLLLESHKTGIKII